MRAEAALADRRAAVRAAARRWRAASGIDEAQLTAIRAAYPDDRRRLGPVFRTLVFAFSALGLVVEAGLLATLAGFALGVGGVALLLGLQCVALTEWQVGPLRRAQAGAEAATGFLAPAFLGFGGLWLLHQAGTPWETTVTVGWVLAAALFAAAMVRWGMPLMATVAVGSFFVFLARFPRGRLGWVGLALTMGPVLLRAGRSARLTPSHRRAATEALIVSALALLVAMNAWSLDLGLVEQMRVAGVRTSPSPSVFARALSAGATVGVPVALLVLAVQVRHRLLLALGALGALAAVATARHYWHIGPLWLAIIAVGLALIAIALGLRRWLDAQPGREARGFTAQPLLDDARRQRVIEATAAVAVLGAGARPPASPEPGAVGGGGEFGGGGATEKF